MIIRLLRWLFATDMREALEAESRERRAKLDEVEDRLKRALR